MFVAFVGDTRREQCVPPLMRAWFAVDVPGLGADLEVARRQPVPMAPVELPASISAGPVLRIEPQARLTIGSAMRRGYSQTKSKGSGTWITWLLPVWRSTLPWPYTQALQRTFSTKSKRRTEVSLKLAP